MDAPSVSLSVLRASTWLYIAVLIAAGASAWLELSSDLLDVVVRIARATVENAPF